MNRCHDWPPRAFSRRARVQPARAWLAAGSLPSSTLLVPCLWLAAALLLPACPATPNATFELNVPRQIAAETTWYEVGVFPDACPSATLLEGGIPPEGTVGRLAFAASAATPPGLGLLPKSTYGIAAVARAADCSVIAVGCEAFHVNTGGTLTVSLSAVPGSPRGACAGGTVCDEASCVPSADAAATTLGASCSLDLVGSGPLADPLNPESTLLSAPAIATTTTGFLLAYREFDPVGGAARLTTIAIDPSGGAAAPVQSSLGGTCVGSPETDATALAFSGAQGTLALSQPACPDVDDAGATVAGVDLIAIDETGTVTDSAFSGKGGLDITLAPAHALAATPAGLLLAFTTPSTQAAFVATVVDLGLASSPAPVLSPASTTSRPSARRSSSAPISAPACWRSARRARTAARCRPCRRASRRKGPMRASAFVPVGRPLPRQWASASGVGSRIIVASSEPSAPSVPSCGTAFDIGSSNTSRATSSREPRVTVSFADVALRQDHAFFAAEVDNDISLFAFDKASTFPILLREVPSRRCPSSPSARSGTASWPWRPPTRASPLSGGRRGRSGATTTSAATPCSHARHEAPAESHRRSRPRETLTLPSRAAPGAKASGTHRWGRALRAVFVPRSAIGDEVEVLVDTSIAPGPRQGASARSRPARGASSRRARSSTRAVPATGCTCRGRRRGRLARASSAAPCPAEWRDEPVTMHDSRRVDVGYRTRARAPRARLGRSGRRRAHAAGTPTSSSVDSCASCTQRWTARPRTLAALLDGAHGARRGPARARCARQAVVELRWEGRCRPAAFGRLEAGGRRGPWAGGSIFAGRRQATCGRRESGSADAGADGSAVMLARGRLRRRPATGATSRWSARLGARGEAAVDAAASSAASSSCTPAPGTSASCWRALRAHPRRGVRAPDACDAARANLVARGLQARVTCVGRRRVRGAAPDRPRRPRSPAQRREEGVRRPRGTSVKAVVYVSCDPPTLGRDLAVLAARFEPFAIESFAMFPRTSHAETVVALRRNANIPPMKTACRRSARRGGPRGSPAFSLRRLRPLRRARPSAAFTATRSRRTAPPASPPGHGRVLQGVRARAQARRRSREDPPADAAHGRPPHHRRRRCSAAGDRVLVAVSGGPDSMALLHVLARLRRKIGHELVAHGVDHGLRTEAERELDRAEALADELEVPFERTRVAVAPGGNLQARARTARLARAASARRPASEPRASQPPTTPTTAPRPSSCACSAAPARTASPCSPPHADLVRPFIRARAPGHPRAHCPSQAPLRGDPSNSEPALPARTRAAASCCPSLERSRRHRRPPERPRRRARRCPDEDATPSRRRPSPPCPAPPAWRSPRWRVAVDDSPRQATARARRPHSSRRAKEIA